MLHMLSEIVVKVCIIIVSDILESYPRSPFLATDADHFLDARERGGQGWRMACRHSCNRIAVQYLFNFSFAEACYLDNVAGETRRLVPISEL